MFDAASEGTLAGVYMERAVSRIEDYTPAETFNCRTVQGAQSLTNGR